MRRWVLLAAAAALLTPPLLIRGCHIVKVNRKYNCKNKGGGGNKGKGKLAANSNLREGRDEMPVVNRYCM